VKLFSLYNKNFVTEFVKICVIFNNVWKWLGYTRKNDCKKALEKHFVLDVDYKVEKAATEVSVAG